MKLNEFLKKERPLVIYSEGATYRPHLAPIVEEYAGTGRPVAYVTSGKDDYHASFDSENIFPFYIGKGVKRTWFFQTVDCDVFLTTMPDLDQMHLKRSIYPVHYVYTQHSLNSLHMVYREGAFDSYDTIFAAGSHHVGELRALEKSRGIKPKNVVEQGYVFLDGLKAAAQAHGLQTRSRLLAEKTSTVLIAPSWGPLGLIENHGEMLIRNLLSFGFEVIVRPHPRTIQLAGKLVQQLSGTFSSHPRFILDSSSNPLRSYLQSDILVTSWSGALFEYALAFGKPVIHIDVPRKTRNPNYQQIDLVPFEVEHRGDFGAICPSGKLGNLGEQIETALSPAGALPSSGTAEVEAKLFALGQGAAIASEYLIELKGK